MTMSDFFQDGPVLGNQYLQDRVLRSSLRRVFGDAGLAEIEPDLERLGERAVTDLLPMAEDANRHEPELVSFDPWGRRIDRIDTAAGWRALDRVSAEEGLVAIAYERRQGTLSRYYQFAKLYLFHPSSAIYTCPLAMTDGAARLLEQSDDEYLKSHALSRLISRDPDAFWTSGQWMTERTGGSDVGRTQTIARREGDGYRLHGTKWFTSATTSQMAMTLARIEDASGNTAEGSRGLSLFYLETHDRDGRLNDITIHRLKDKLGTRALPTAELTLEGTKARLVGEPGRGVRNIASLINVTRAYNSLCAVASFRRAIALARDYAGRRQAFGKRLAEHPLHLETLANLQVDFEAAFHLTFHVVALMGKEECGEATPADSAVLRLLTPLAKLYTGKLALAGISEILESFGGAGYVEDTGLPRMLRDAQVMTIWEGTTNILSLDALRAIEKEQAFLPYLEDLDSRLEGITLSELSDEVGKTRQALREIQVYLPKAIGLGLDLLQAGARGFAFSLARAQAAVLLMEQAQWSKLVEGDTRALNSAKRWCRQPLAPLVPLEASTLAVSRSLALDVVETDTGFPSRTRG